MQPTIRIAGLLSLGLLSLLPAARAETPVNLRDENLVAWCIVPIDSKQRGPAERAEMVKRLGLRRVAYDWRAQHVPTFEEEILQYKKHGIEYFAFWGSHEAAFTLFEKYGLHPQIWQTLPSPGGDNQEARIQAAAERMLPLVERTRKLGSKLGLYNHGGWGGEPDNMIAVCKFLREKHQADHVGIVYNLHHGHGHIDDFAKVLSRLKPYLLCLNLNGMTENGDQRGKKILPLGEGEFDLTLLKAVRDSGYDGPIGIIGHTQDDVEQRLHDNLDGLHWLLPQLEGKPAGPKPELRTWSNAASPRQPAAKLGGTVLEGRPEFRSPPLTVECRVTLKDSQGYNILVASDTKASGDHWELFSMNGSGLLTVYLPGRKPDHVRSQANICDGRSHTVAMTYEPDRVRLYLDGKPAADEQIESLNRAPRPGGLAIGRLVEGGLGCRGKIDWVRISRGVREIPAEPLAKVEKDDATLLLHDGTASHDHAAAAHAHHGGTSHPSARFKLPPEYAPQLVADLVAAAHRHGDAHRGLMVFASAKSACISCHKIGERGGSVGPPLTKIAKERKPAELVESVLWPKRQVKPEFVVYQIIDADGRTHQGAIVRRDEQQIVLRDPTKPDAGDTTIAVAEIELQRELGSLMPENLTAAMSEQQLRDLLRFVMSLGSDDGLAAGEMDHLLMHAQAHLQGPAAFEFDRRPLEPELWPDWQLPVNRDRVYDFYTKQARHFRDQSPTPPLLAEFPGLDGGELGHWGNQNDTVWADDRWNSTRLGSIQCGVLRDGKLTVPRGVCVNLGTSDQLATCFNPDTLSYEAAWSGGFVKFSARRHGFVDGLRIEGKRLADPAGNKPAESFRYRGFYRHGDRVVFAYRVGEQELLNVPVAEAGQVRRIVAPAAALAARRACPVAAGAGDADHVGGRPRLWISRRYDRDAV